MGVADFFVSGYVEAGESVLSSPGLIWTERTQPFTTSPIDAIDYANGVWIIVGDDGKIARSTDGGVSWGSLISNPFGTSDLRGVSHGDGIWIAVSLGGNIARSSDLGLTWGSLITNPFGASNIFSVAYGGGVWVACGANGYIARSTDGGVTWGSLISNPFGSSSVMKVSYANGVWIAVGYDGKIARSTDGGVTWGSLITNPFGANAIRGIAYGSGVWVAVGAGDNIARSIDDGETWQSIDNPFGGINTVMGVAHGAGVWVAIGVAGRISRSTDGGVVWGSRVYGDNDVSQPFGTDGLYRDVAVHEGRFVVVGYYQSTSYGLLATSDWLEAGSGIVEQGTNSDGDYVRFSSGLQECWHTLTLTAYPTTWTFPKAFASVGSGSHPWAWGVKNDSVQTNVVVQGSGLSSRSVYAYNLGTSATVTSGEVEVFARGYWK